MYYEPDHTPPPLRHSRRMLAAQRLLAVVVAVAAFAAAGALVARTALTDTAPGAPVTQVSASASAIVVLSPGQKAQRVAATTPVVGGQTEAAQSKAAYRYPADGSLVDAARLWSTATIRERTRTARSRSDVGKVSLLGGRIVLDNVSLRTNAQIAGGRASSTFALQDGASLVVDGAPVALRPNHVVSVPGVATVTLNEQAVVAQSPTGDAHTGPRARVVGAIAHVRLTSEAGGLPAGSELIVGRVEAGVRQGKVKAVAHPGAGQIGKPSTPGGIPNLQAGAPRPGELDLPRRPSSVRGAGSVSGALNGYLFPVLGASNYSNDWGAPRASTGTGHQGNDIFAPEGTPLVAVADGVLDRVGWNSIGGYRLWLFDAYGNSFYYAHLSAFTPLAQDGARVRAGDVIGFMGHTGDAQFTPPHVHFEIHPGNGAAINPFPFLNAWKRGIATAIGGLGGGANGPLTLLDAADIAPNSGLEHSVLGHVHAGARPVSEETKPKPTDETLKEAISGDGISG